MDRIRNDKVGEISKTVRERRSKWYGHVMSSEYVEKLVMSMDRDRGREEDRRVGR